MLLTNCLETKLNILFAEIKKKKNKTFSSSIAFLKRNLKIFFDTTYNR